MKLFIPKCRQSQTGSPLLEIEVRGTSIEPKALEFLQDSILDASFTVSFDLSLHQL